MLEARGQPRVFGVSFQEIKLKDWLNTDKITHPSGATSSRIDERYDLIPYAAMEAMARRFALGAKKHGADNYKKGDADYARERLNHLWKHLALFSETGKAEDLDAIICNAAILCFFKSKGLIDCEPRLQNKASDTTI
jgi:hypothetical protein